jgi:hypothetical protein
VTDPLAPTEDQLDDLVELVSTGPVDLGAYTQAELAVVLGQLPALGAVEADVLAEAVRSLAARGVLYRQPGSAAVEVVGDLGLVVALVATGLGALEVRRGHAGAADEPWRWVVTLLPKGLVGIDRVDALGLHRLSLMSVAGLADTIAERLIDGPARIPAEVEAPVPVTDDVVARVAQQAEVRWQLIFRRRRPDGTRLVVDALLLRTGRTRMDLVFRNPSADGYERVAVDRAALREYLIGLTRLE